MPWYSDYKFFQNVRFYDTMETFLFSEINDSEKTVYYVNLQNEAKSFRHSTRALEWELNRWEYMCHEFYEKISKRGVIQQILYIQQEKKEEWALLLEKRFLAHFKCQVLEYVMPFIPLLYRQEKYILPEWKSLGAENSNYWKRGEYFRQEYNVNVLNS